MKIKGKDIFEYKHFLILLLFIPLQLFFVYCEKKVVPEYFMYSKIDSYIPFVKEFIIPYLLWYIYMIFAFTYLGFCSKKDFYKLFAFIFLGMIISCIIYLIFPNAQNLRPVITDKDVFSLIVKDIYTIDTPTNVAPSIHVINSIAVHSALTHYPKFRSCKRANLISFISCIIISFSTVFVKQHSIKDVLWAVVLSAILYFIIYGIPKLMESRVTAEEGMKL